MWIILEAGGNSHSVTAAANWVPEEPSRPERGKYLLASIPAQRVQRGFRNSFGFTSRHGDWVVPTNWRYAELPKQVASVTFPLKAENRSRSCQVGRPVHWPTAGISKSRRLMPESLTRDAVVLSGLSRRAAAILHPSQNHCQCG